MVLALGYVVPFIALTAMDWHGHIDVHRFGFVQTELKNWSSPAHLVSPHDWFSVLASFLLLANVMSAAAAYILHDASVLADVKQADIGAALIAFGYFLGSSISSKRKDEMKGTQ